MIFGSTLIISGVAFLVGAICAATWGPDTNDQLGVYVTGCVLVLLGCSAVVLAARSRKIRVQFMTPERQPQPRGSTRERRNLQTSVTASHAEIATQFATGAAMDSQLMGMLAFLATSGGVFAVVKHALHADRWILLVGVCMAAAACVYGSVRPLDIESGPLPSDFYNLFGGAPETSFLAQLLSELKDTILINDQALQQRRGALIAAFSLLLVTAVIFGLARLWGLVQ